MLVIRQEQLDVFNDSALKGFFDRASHFLRTYAQKHVAYLDDLELMQFVRASYKLAYANGVRGERALVTWMFLQVIAGEDFYKESDVASVLRRGKTIDGVLNDILDRLAFLQIRYGKL